MNLLTFLLILMCCNVLAEKTNKQIAVSTYASKLLEDFLEKFKTTLRTGDEKLGIPVLDPFNADHLDIKLNKEIIKLDALLTKVNLNGLSQYKVINANLTMSQIIVVKLHLSWPLIIGNTNYSMKGNVDVFKVYGKGDIKMSAQNFAFETEIHFKVEGGMINGHLKIQDMKLKLSLNLLKLQITGLYNNKDLSALLSAVISDTAPELISNDKVVQEIKQQVSKQLNDFLSTKTIWELLKMLM